MATIAQNLQSIINSKEAIRQSINNKGGSVTTSTPLADYAAAIDALPSGGGGGHYITEVAYPWTGGSSLGSQGLSGFISELNIPSSVTTLSSLMGSSTSGILIENTSIKTITCGTISTCNSGTFNNLRGLETLDGDFSNITSIPDSFLRNCFNIEEFPNIDFSKITSIGASAFQSCATNTDAMNNLDITLSNYGITSSMSGSYIFNATKIRSFTLDDNNYATYSSTNSIGSYVFYNCPNLTTVHFPPAYIGAGSYAFENCPNLTSIELSGMTNLNNSRIFHNCSSLEIVLDCPFLTNSGLSTSAYAAFSNSGITKIANLGNVQVLGYNTSSASETNNTFYQCTNLKNVIFPYSITQINGYIFYGSGIQEVTCFKSTPPTLNANAFAGCNSLTDIYVPGNVVSNYQSATNWSAQSSKIKSIPPLTLRALTAGTLTYTRNENTKALSYSTDGGSTWTSSTGNLSFNLAAGDKVLFRGDVSNTYGGAANGMGTFGGTAQIEAYGYLSSIQSSTGYTTLTSTTNNNAYYGFFMGFTNLIDASGVYLPMTTLTTNCYALLFKGCTNLKYPPVLPATSLAQGCYQSMFEGCTSLNHMVNLPATTLAASCYKAMFKGCTNLLYLPPASSPYALPATTLAASCYESMFEGCTRLSNMPYMYPARSAVKPASCYKAMFKSCTSLQYIKSGFGDAKLDGSSTSSYESMFEGSGLIELNVQLNYSSTVAAASGATGCFKAMFKNCVNLTKVSYWAYFTDTVTIVPESCFESMFEGCTSLTTWSAGIGYITYSSGRTFSKNCMKNMFKGCEALTAAPVPCYNNNNHTMQESCFESMYEGCTSLRQDKRDNSTNKFYFRMSGAAGVNSCKRMFYGCSSLDWLYSNLTNISASGATEDWVYGVAASGTFSRPSSSASIWSTGTSGIPSGWSVING